jgi:hypothetical protein
MSGEADEIRQVAHKINDALHDSDEPLSTPVILSGLAVAVAGVAAVEVTHHDRPLNPEEAASAERIIALFGEQAKMALQREDLS